MMSADVDDGLEPRPKRHVPMLDGGGNAVTSRPTPRGVANEHKRLAQSAEGTCSRD